MARQLRPYPPLKLSGHIFFRFFFLALKKFFILSGPAFTYSPPPFSSRNTKKKHTYIHNKNFHYLDHLLTCRSGHWALLEQLTGWSTQPTTGVGLGMKEAGQEHWARWFTTWHLAFGPHAFSVHGSTHLYKIRIHCWKQKTYC